MSGSVLKKNVLIDTADLTIGAKSADMVWTAAETIAAHFGIKSLTVANIDFSSKSILWANSSMSSEWLTQYSEAGYFHVDPFLQKENYFNDSIAVTCGALSVRADAATTSIDLNHGLKDAGYSQLQGHMAGHNDDGTTRLVSLCFQDGAEAGLTDATAHALACLIGAAVTAPLPERHPDHFMPQPITDLSDRERDVLSLLAEGRMGYEIAHHLNISETMVQRHLRNARQKLNARTREEALLIAIRTQQISI